jgi:hypothetical protein
MTDKALALLQEYAEGRQAEKALLRQVRAQRCEEYEKAVVGGALDGPEPGNDGVPHCYEPGGDEFERWCETCQRRDPLFRQMVARKRENRRLLRRLEIAALQQPGEPAAQEEPRLLLDLMEPAGLTTGGHEN